MKKALAIGVVSSFVSQVGYASLASKCDYVFRDSAKTVLDQIVKPPQTRTDRILPINAKSAESEHVMFGFESEYTISSSSLLLKAYMPRAEFGISKDAWLNKSDAERMAWAKNYIETRPEFSRDSGLTKIIEGEGLEFLPQEPIRDDTGNIELVLPPVNELAVLDYQVRTINSLFGAGSMQAMISAPKKSFFYTEHADKIAGKKGFFTLVSEVDALQKLSIGAERYVLDPSKDVARSFAHPFLGPVSKHRQEFLTRYLVGNAEGKLFDKVSLKKIPYSEDSFKYTGTSAYRPDIGGSSRVSVEVRDAHTNQELLLEKVQRVVAAYTRGTDRFAKFSNIESFDSRKEFNKLTEPVQWTLTQLFPAKAERDQFHTANEVFAQEVYRNFAYPLRNWQPILKAIGKERYLVEVSRAQATYLQKLQNITDLYVEGRIDKAEASRQVQGALALFLVKSGLKEHLEFALLDTL